jgi:hypothetical protein
VIPYPAPQHALTLWLRPSGDLAVAVPPLPGHDRGHTLTVPCTASGFAWLSKFMRLRDSATAIGTPSCPTQYDLESIGKALAPAQRLARTSAKRFEDLSFD